MSIDAEVLNAKVVESLCDMYAAVYATQSLSRTHDPIPSMLNALGACAGFAAQAAVWRELVLPANRNPGDFFVYIGPKSQSGEIYFYGEAINQFLLSTGSDRLSFLSLAAATLSKSSELQDIGELASHVVQSLGTESFGRPRVPASIDLIDLPREALTKTWGKVAHMLHGHRTAEWPALLGAAAYNIIDSNRKLLAPPTALRILLEAAVPMSKLNPATVGQSTIPPPTLTNWSMRALRPENNQEIVTEARGAMPAMPSRISARRPIIHRPKIAFLNLSGAGCEAIVAEDLADIGGLFHGRVEVASTPAPTCDVLFLYCAFERSGKIVGQELSLRGLIRDSAASAAVIASEVRGDLMADPEFQKSWNGVGYPPVNLVITSNRNGKAFGRFYKSLFQLMWTGVPVPMAWVTLAPQGPHQPPDIPGAICLMSAGQIAFDTGRLW